MTDPGADKKILRAELRALLRTPPADRGGLSARICEQILALPEWQNAQTVALFCPLPSEPAVDPLLQVALAEGKRVALPRICGDELRWIRITPEDERVASLRFAHLEEPAGTEVILPAQLDLVLVPGLGFGSGGERLGRGGGYYDRALAAMPPEVVRLGVCYALQIREYIPRESHDRKVDRVITD
jgi:5-formyltetrahydrofolate cyclo-ligase